MKIAVFASGFGSNFEAIIQAQKEQRLCVDIALLVSDKPDSYAVERAKKHQIPVFTLRLKDFISKEDYELTILNELKNKKIELIVLAGYMKLIGKTLLNAFPKKILNIHPALLPAFPGMHAIEQAYNYGVKMFGVTVHYVDEGMDTGQIIAQDGFLVDDTDTLESIETKIHQIEHRLYPAAIEKIGKL
jgi:phosphoribosylglycinamide formyltransferase-1